jgi:DNA-binding MurR/RpiR family transcriptional regulator
MGDDFHGRTIRQQVHHRLGELTPAERRVARVLLTAYPIAGLETVAELADRAGVSFPTVTRFVTSLGFDGYRAFQRALRREVQEQVSSPSVRYPSQARQVSIDDVQRAALEELSQVLRETFIGTQVTELDAIADLLSDARGRVFCVGGRVSHVCAQYLYSRLYQLRPACHLLTAGPLPLSAHLLEIGDRDVLVAFDYRRYQDDVVELAERAAEQGAAVVLVTDRWLSPIVEVSSHVMTAETETGSPFDSIVGSVALIEVLVAALVERIGQPGRERIQRLDGLRNDVVNHVNGDHSTNVAASRRRRSTRTSKTSGRA